MMEKIFFNMDDWMKQQLPVLFFFVFVLNYRWIFVDISIWSMFEIKTKKRVGDVYFVLKNWWIVKCFTYSIVILFAWASLFFVFHFTSIIIIIISNFVCLSLSFSIIVFQFRFCKHYSFRFAGFKWMDRSGNSHHRHHHHHWLWMIDDFV